MKSISISLFILIGLTCACDSKSTDSSVEPSSLNASSNRGSLGEIPTPTPSGDPIPDLSSYILNRPQTFETPPNDRSEPPVLTPVLGQDGYSYFSIANSDDDAEEQNGQVQTKSQDLDVKTAKSVKYLSALLFHVRIPESAVIEEAYLEFTSRVSNTNSTAITIAGISGQRPATFVNGSTNSLSSLAKTSSSSVYVSESWERDTSYSTENIKDIVIEQIAGSSSIEQVVGFVLEGTGRRSIISFDYSPSDAVKLKIKFK